MDQRTGRVDVGKLRGTWYDDFFSMAMSGLTKEQIEGIFANVSFINFNYDRSLECFLFHALTNSAHASATAAANIIDNLNVIRPYGSLGELDLKRQPYVGGGEDIFEMATRIRTFTEAHESDIQKRITETLDHSSLVIALGFGFHPQNIALLIPPDSSKRQVQFVFTTVKGIHRENLQRIESELARCFTTGRIKMLGMTAHELLSDLRLSILAAAN